MRWFDKLRKAVSKLFRRSNVESAFGVSIAVSSKMEDAMQLWSEMFEDHPPWKDEEKGRLTMNLPASVSSEIARLVTLEMKTEVTGSPRADYLNKQYQPVVKKARRFTDYACAKGGVALKPFVADGRIFVSIVQHDDFYPVAFDSDGNVTAGVFLDYSYKGTKKYTRMELHKLEGTTYTVENKAYCIEVSEVTTQNDNALGTEVPLTDVEEWATVAPVVTMENIEMTLFAYFKMPFANHIEPRSPLGVSVYSKAVEQIKEADRQWSETSWEYQAGEMAIHAASSLFTRDQDGKPILPQGKERLFRTFDYDRDQKLDPYAPSFRDQSLYNGLNKMIQRVEFLCGLAYGTLSEPSQVDKTATEVKQSRQRSFSTVADIQKALQDALDHLLYAMNTLASLYELAPEGEYNVSYYWDDSLIVDSEAQRLMDLQEVSARIMKEWEYRVKWYGEDEETAKLMAGEENDPSDDEIMDFTDEPDADEGKNNPDDK